MRWDNRFANLVDSKNQQYGNLIRKIKNEVALDLRKFALNNVDK